VCVSLQRYIVVSQNGCLSAKAMIRIIIVFVVVWISQAHFPLVDNAHGGEIFDKWDNAAEITDITRSSSTSRVSLCGHLFFWLKFTRPEGFDTLMIGGTVPVIGRFKDVRVAAAVFGRGLPGAGATQDEINTYCDRSLVGRTCMGYDDLPDDLKTAHGEIQTSLGVTDLGVIAVPGVDDLSNCDFGEDPLTVSVTGSLYVESGGGDDISYATYYDWGGETHCFFHEEFGGSDMWIVQDKLIGLAGEGDHFIAFWSPDDHILGEPTQPAKFGAVFGDEGQSEDFNGETIRAGECSLPAQDFYEQDCHGYRKPIIPSIIESIYNLFLPETWITNFFYLPWGGAPCISSYAASVPNVYMCGDDEPEKACTNLCHNHGFCPADPSLNEGGTPFDTSECTSKTNEDGFPMCGETCAREMCGGGVNATTDYGPIGPACVNECKTCGLFESLWCNETCGMPSDECYGIYEEEHSV